MWTLSKKNTKKDKKEWKKENSLRIYGTISADQHSYYYGSQKEERKRTENLFEEIMSENS